MRTGTKGLLLLAVIGMLLAACGQTPPSGAPASTGATAAPAATTAPAATAVAAPATTAPAAADAAPSSAAAPTAPAAATPAPATPSASGEMVQITFWTGPNNPEGGPPPDDWAVYKVLREKLNIDRKLTLLPIGADGETKLNAAAAANELPDLFGLTRNQF